MATPRRTLAIALLAAATLAACARDPGWDNGASARREPAPANARGAEAPGDRPAGADRWAEAFPHVRVNAARRSVEFDAAVSELLHPDAPDQRFYLEQFVCLRGTKDHESPLVTDARPSHIHAALLLAGLEPGRPVEWTYPGGDPTPLPPEGDAVDVVFVLNGREIRPESWAVDRDSGLPFPRGRWVFAGSTEITNAGRTIYEADAAGTVVGLASFGSETVAWHTPISHEEEAGDLRWIANKPSLPAAGTPVVVRITAAD
jgi:hypothetical protein